MGVAATGENTGKDVIRIGCRLYIMKGEAVAGGAGLVKILEAIEATGSLSAAAKMLGMNYKRLWMKLETAERVLGARLVERGRGRQGSRLTPLGKSLVESYRVMARKLRECGFS